MLTTVELPPGHRIGQPMVSSTVDDHDVGTQFGGNLMRVTVREGEEHHVVAAQRLGGRRLQEAIGQRPQVRLVHTEPVAGAGIGGQRADLDQGVGQ